MEGKWETICYNLQRVRRISTRRRVRFVPFRANHPFVSTCRPSIESKLYRPCRYFHIPSGSTCSASGARRFLDLYNIQSEDATLLRRLSIRTIYCFNGSGCGPFFLSLLLSPPAWLKAGSSAGLNVIRTTRIMQTVYENRVDKIRFQFISRVFKNSISTSKRTYCRKRQLQVL